MTAADGAPTDTVGRLDSVATAIAAVTFAVGMGVGMVALPLLTLQAGYGEGMVGLLAAASAVAQLVCRVVLPILLRRFSDRAVIGIAALLQAVSYASLLLTTSLPSFALAQVLQGSARGFFWTASMTHAVRRPGSAVRALVPLNLMATVGELAGALMAGLLAGSNLVVPLALACGTGILSWVTSLRLHLFPAFKQAGPAPEQDVWRRPSIWLGSFASFTSGGWRALLGSYVPVILQNAGLPTSVIGGLIAVGTGASAGVTVVLLRLRSGALLPAIYVSAALTAGGLLLLPFMAGNVFAAGLLLAASGAGAGALLTLGPAFASGVAAPSEQGEVMAITGTLRAAGLLMTPGVVAAMLSFVSLTWAMVFAGLAIGVPVMILGGARSLRRK